MARVLAVLAAAGKTQWRNLRSLQSVAGNNFFLFVLLLMQNPQAAAFLLLLMGVLILFPLSADPLRLVPRERLALWPLSRADLIVLRVASFALSPVAWIMILVLWRTSQFRPVFELAAVAAVIQAGMLGAGALTRRLPSWNVLRWVPRLPGALGGLLQVNLRQILSTLDFYVAFTIALCGYGYRLLAHSPDPSALAVLSVLVVLAMSTYAQCLFGLDGAGGQMRYRLLPVRGWTILAAKDTAWLMATLLLGAGLSPRAAIAGALVALSIGHHGSIMHPVQQFRWRFTSGRLIMTGVIQCIGLFSAGMVAHREGWLWVAGSLLLYAASLAAYGFLWDRKSERHAT